MATIAGVLARPSGYAGVWSWITTVDHKRIGILYGFTAFITFLVAGIEAGVMRMQLARADSTFIDPDVQIKLKRFKRSREFSLIRKFGMKEHKIKGKRIVLVDDSIVRGNTMRKIIGTLYRLGAEEVHLRIGCPPITHSCFYGINTPTREELIAYNRNEKEIRGRLGAHVRGELKIPTSLKYLSYKGTMQAIPFARESRCDACLTGNYPIPVDAMPV